MRLIASIAKRMAELQPDYPGLGRLKGIRRFVWSQSQMRLAPVRPLLRSLAEAGFPLLLIKGAARHAADPGSAADRLIRDVDVVAPLDRVLDVHRHARAEGWELWGWQVEEIDRGLITRHNAWSLRKGEGEIDLHHFAIGLNRNPGDDDALWARARPASLQGIPVLLPSPADSLLLTIVHGVRFSEEGIADWAIDAAAAIDRGDVDWRVLAEETQARRLQAPVYAGLSYLKERLGRRAPDDVLQALSSAAEPFLGEFQGFISSETPGVPQMRASAAALSVRAVDALSRRGLRLNPAPPDRLIKQFVAPVPPERTQFRLRLTLDDRVQLTDRMRVRLQIQQPPQAAHRVHVTVGEPDIYLFAGMFGPAEDAEGWRSQEIEVPAALFRLRGVDSLTAVVRIKDVSAGEAMVRSARMQLWGPARAQPGAS